MEIIESVTPKEEALLKELKEYKYSKNNNNYSVKLGKYSENKIIIKIQSLSIINSNYFQYINDLNELQKIHKSFRYFDSIDETLTSLNEIFESNKYELDIKDNDKISLILKIPKFGKGEENIVLEMKKHYLSLNNISEDLIKKLII